VLPLATATAKTRLAPLLAQPLDVALKQHGSWEHALATLPNASYRVTLHFAGEAPRLLAGPDQRSGLRRLTPVSQRAGFVEATIQPEHDAAWLVVRARDGDVLLERIEVRPWATAKNALAQAEAGQLAPIELDREVRPGWVLAPGGEQRLPVVLPADATRLTLAVGPQPDGEREPAELVLTWTEGAGAGSGRREPQELLRVAVQGSRRRWREQRLPLSGLAGRTGTLTLSNAGPGALVVDIPELHCESGATRPNLVIVSLDTTRPDRLGAYGYERDTTPRLRQLAAAGVLCEDVLSVSAYTLPSHATLFSGMHPLGHGVVHPGHALDTSKVPLLADLLRARGYATRAFTGGGYLSPDYGFHHGFGSYGLHDPARPVTQAEREWMMEDSARGGAHAERVVALGWPAMLKWIGARREVPFFLFVQTYAIHDYRAGSERSRYGAPPEGQGAVPLRTLERQRDEPYDALEQRELGDIYDGAIRRMDGLLGRLIDRLESADVAQRTIIVVLSDHGETLGEHNLGAVSGVGHGFGLWDEQVRVPLIVVAPGLAPGRVSRRVSLLDVAPTLLELLDVPAPDAMQGRSLLALLRGDPDAPPPSPVLLDLDTPVARARALYHQDAKLILGDPEAWVTHPVIQPAWLFDRRKDPTEQHDLAASRPRDVERLTEQLQALVQFYRVTGGGPAQAELSPETLQALAELGYLER